MKKISLTQILLIMLFAFGIFFAQLAAADTGYFTINTFYPPADGIYEKVNLDNLQMIPQVPKGAGECNEDQQGLMYYAGDDQYSLFICRKTGDGVYVWKKIGGSLWTQTEVPPNYVYLKDQGSIANYDLEDPKVGIGTENPDLKLTIGSRSGKDFFDGGILALGKFGEGDDLGDVPDLASVFIWYPQKASIRAGYSNNSVWDDGNIGNYSAAFGRESYAYKEYSIVSGKQGIAGNMTGGADSSAMGGTSYAYGNHSLAMGHRLYSGTFAETTFGLCNTNVGGSQINKVLTQRLFAIGNGVVNNGDDCFSRSEAIVMRKDGWLKIVARDAGAIAVPTATAPSGQLHVFGDETLFEGPDVTGYPTMIVEDDDPEIVFIGNVSEATNDNFFKIKTSNGQVMRIQKTDDSSFFNSVGDIITVDAITSGEEKVGIRNGAPEQVLDVGGGILSSDDTGKSGSIVYENTVNGNIVATGALQVKPNALPSLPPCEAATSTHISDEGDIYYDNDENCFKGCTTWRLVSPPGPLHWENLGMIP